MEVPDQWIVRQGDYNGRPLFVRFDAASQNLVGSPAWPFQIGIAVPLHNPTRDGLPQGLELQQLDEIEELIWREASDHAVFVGVITTSGMREFVLYAADLDFADYISSQLSRVVLHHECQVIAQPDPDWSIFQQLAIGDG